MARPGALWALAAVLLLPALPSAAAPQTSSQRATLHELEANQGFDAATAERSDTVIREVIARKEFRQAEREGFLQRLQMMIMAAVLDLLDRISAALGGLGPIFKVLGLILLAALLALLVLLLARLIDALLLRLAGRQRRTAAAHETRTPLAEVARGPAAAEQALARARALAAQGQWLEALRLAFASLLLSLDASGAIDFREGITNWDYLREVRRDGRPQAGPLEGAIRLFELKWYGLRGAGPGDFEAMVLLVQESRAAGEARP